MLNCWITPNVRVNELVPPQKMIWLFNWPSEWEPDLPDTLILRVWDDDLITRVEDNVANVVVVTTARVDLPRPRLVKPPQFHLSVVRSWTDKFSLPWDFNVAEPWRVVGELAVSSFLGSSTIFWFAAVLRYKWYHLLWQNVTINYHDNEMALLPEEIHINYLHVPSTCRMREDAPLIYS